MRNFMEKMNMKMEATTESNAGAAPNPPPAPSPEPDDNLDELGYEKVVPEKGGKDEGNEEETSKETKTEEEVKDPATGYGEEPPEVKEEPEAEPVVDEKVEPEKTDLELKAEGLLPEEIKEIKEFAKKHGVSKEAAQALVAKKQEEVKKLNEYIKEKEKQTEIETQKQRKKWHDELKNDKTFGGEKFAHNIKRAEKVVEEFMPNLKKVLTESKVMLPPYVMRDLVKLANHLYSTEKLVQGDPSIPSKPEAEQDDALAFYNS